MLDSMVKDIIDTMDYILNQLKRSRYTNSLWGNKHVNEDERQVM